MVTSVNPSSLMVSWQPPLEINQNGVITGYLILNTRIESGDITSDTITRGTTHTISGLIPFVNYSVRIAAVNANGTGPFSDAIVEVSGQDSKLLNVSV